MAKPNRLKELEKEHGPLEQVIPKLVNQMGSAKAAEKHLGVTDSTIVMWLKKHGYVSVTRYVKPKKEIGA